MTSCNLVFGRTGCGKTSLRNMLCGEDPEEDSLRSGTTDAQVLEVTSDGKRFLYVDTAGILDTRGEGEEMKNSRADKVNQIGRVLKRSNLTVCRVFYCVSSTERLLKEEIDWLADIIQMLGGQKVMQVFAIILTKVDAGFQKRKFEKDFDNHELVKTLRGAFTNCPVVTSGYDNVDSVKRLLVPCEEEPSFSVTPDVIKVVIPKADLETQLTQTRTKLAEVVKTLQGKESTESDIKRQIDDLDAEIDSLNERIANAGWWCPWPEIDKANQRIRECRSLMRDLKSNNMKTAADKASFERTKQTLIDAIKEAERELQEKRSLGKMFMRLWLS